MGNPYIHYNLGQQDGRGMPVFRGSSWQRGYGQVGYGLGGLFRSLGKIAKPMIKSGARALGNIALTSGMSLPVKASNKQQEPALWKARTPQRCKLYNERRGMLKPDEGVGVLEAAGVPPKREKHQEPNAELKRERHQHLRPDVNRPSEREHLLETYSVKYEFRARLIGGVCQN